MKHFLLFYETAPNYLERRGEFRGVHLAHANAAVARGDLLLGGALADPVDAAVLLFRGENSKVAEDFAREDPYVANGIVLGWRVREWTTVVGEDALAQI